ncbi:MAG: radical SAM protein [Eggerthellaceae bacterium]|nr:radical SAM protein [Eggerthellaceae bacterium]
MIKPTKILLYGTAPESIVDGPGLRFGVFVQGCSHHCPGCHNPQSQLIGDEDGYVETIDALMDQIKENRLIRDVTLSGGEPFEQALSCAEVAKRCKALGFGVWAYTGYLFEDLLRIANTPCDDEPVFDESARPSSSDKLHPKVVKDFLDNIDVLVDGPFVESRKSMDVIWRGSTNQRVIDVPKSIIAGHVVDYPVTAAKDAFPTRPVAW